MKRILAFLLLVTFSHFVLSVDITDVFTVQTGSTLGACTSAQIVTLTQWLTESATLAGVGFTALQSYSTDKLVREHAAAFFGINPKNGDFDQGRPATPAYLTAVRTYYEEVQKVLAMPTQYQFVHGKPPLYCDSTWLVVKAWSDQAMDANGNLAKKPDGSPLLLQDVPAYRGLIRSGLLPYYSAAHKDYVFDIARTGGTFCADTTNDAVTNSLVPNSITICPVAFTATTRTATLGGKVPAVGTLLSECDSRSSTLLHESFHARFFSDFLSGSQETYTAPACLQLVLGRQGNHARKNPDSYVYFALAMLYSTRNWGTASSPSFFTFKNGVAAARTA